MSALGDMASAAGGAVTGGLWKIGAILLAGLLLFAGGGWWLAAHDRDVARADLLASQRITAELRVGVDAQNKAILAQAKLAREAEARGLVAQQLAAANGRRFDGALSQLAGKRATTCAEAMPAVNQLLESVR